MTDAPMDSVGLMDLVERAADQVEPLVAAVTEEAWARPTPCPDFDLRALTGHLVGSLRGFADAGDGRPLRFDLDPDLAAEDARTAYREAADRLVAVFRRPGMLERSFAMPWGDTTGAQLMGFELIELLVHGWDIARSLGVEPDLDDDLVEATLAGARQWVDESTRIPVLFGPEVPVPSDAAPLDRLVGFLGRSPS